MAKLGFLGLGIMGYPMARHLIEAGHEVFLWSNTAKKAQKLAQEAHSSAYLTPKNVAEQADCIFLCVGDSAMSVEVLLGKNGVIEGAKPGTVVADCSTISPSVSRNTGAKLAEKGIHYLDAPCTGSKAGAEGGTLTFMIGGDKSVFEKTKPFFEAMGKNFYYCGGSGLGLHAKLSQNLILSNMLQAFNEGMVLAVKAGVDPAQMVDILNNSAAKSGLIASKAPAVLKRNFDTAFSTKWMCKDVTLALDSAGDLMVPLPLTGVTQQMYRAAISMGYGEEDLSATVKVLENIAGVEVKES